MEKFIARGYCRNKSFAFQPHSNIEAVSKIVSNQEQLHVIAGEVDIRMTRGQRSCDTDHWHETDYLCYQATVKLGEKRLVAKQVDEFLLQLDGDTLVLGLRMAPSVKADEQSSRSGHTTEVHLISTSGLYRLLGNKECGTCAEGHRMTRALRGCNKCLAEHMCEFRKEPA